LKIWLKRCSVFVLVIAIITAWKMMLPPSQKECSLCGNPKRHAPCILNLATGEIGELELYQPHFSKAGEISDQQTGGTFSFIQAAGLTGIKLTDPWYIEIVVPMKGERKNETLFCKNCLKKLENCDQGYVLMDVYDKRNPVILVLEDGAMYTVRCYQIGVSINQEKEGFLVRMDGQLFQ